MVSGSLSLKIAFDPDPDVMVEVIFDRLILRYWYCLFEDALPKEARDPALAPPGRDSITLELLPHISQRRGSARVPVPVTVTAPVPVPVTVTAPVPVPVTVTATVDAPDFIISHMHTVGMVGIYMGRYDRRYICVGAPALLGVSIYTYIYTNIFLI